MGDSKPPSAEMLAELQALRTRVRELERAETERKRVEDALRESEERFQQVVANAEEWIWEVNTEGLYTYTSPVVEDVLGYKPEELVGKKHFFDLFHPENREELKTLAFGVFDRKRRFYGFVNRNVHKNGETVWLSTSGVPMLDEQGELLGYRGSDSNITERKVAEEELKQSEREKALILGSVSELVTYQDRQLRVIWANQAAGESVGSSPEQLAGRHCFEIWQQRSEPCVDCPVAKVLETGQSHQGEKTSPDGRVWLVRGYPARDEEGNVIGAVEITRDITERKHAEEALRDSETLLRTVINATKEAMVSIDQDGLVTLFNPAAEEMFGRKRKEMIGQPLDCLLPEEYRKRHTEYVRSYFATGEPHNAINTTSELSGLRSNGDVFPAEVSLSAGRHGNKQFVIAVARDVTERNRLQQQLLQSQKLESIGTLAGGIAHDFNNLLAVIVGNTSVLQRRATLPAEIRDLLNDIMNAADRGSALTRQLLAYAQGGLQKPAPTDLNRLIKSVLRLLERTTPPQIEFVLSLPKDLPLIMADASQGEQVVMNLCLNAVQASQPPSTIEVSSTEETVGADRAAELELVEGRYVCLQVKDQGCGMDAETVQRVFEPFFTTKPTGRGMGLAATQGIVHSHHGQIRAESMPGGGTTMSVWLPTTREAVRVLARETAPQPIEPPHGSETVLVIDDDSAVTRTVEQILSTLGYCVVPHTDTDEALAFLDTNSEDIDLVLMNLNMPKCSGMDMLTQILQRCPRIPVLLASGLESRGLVESLMARGAVGFLRKPFSLMTLAKAIRGGLDDAANSPGRSGN